MNFNSVLFTADMVNATLAGTKRQHRLPMKPQPPEGAELQVELYSPTKINRKGEEYPGAKIFGASTLDGELRWKSPFGGPGMRLWVQETFWECIDNNDRIRYVADGPAPTTDRRHYRKCPSTNLTFNRSRIMLAVKRVWVGRVQDITRSDVRAEGVPETMGAWLGTQPNMEGHEWDNRRWNEQWQYVWDSIYAAKGFGFDANPWVWACEFELIENEREKS